MEEIIKLASLYLILLHLHLEILRNLSLLATRNVCINHETHCCISSSITPIAVTIGSDGCEWVVGTLRAIGWFTGDAI